MDLPKSLLNKNVLKIVETLKEGKLYFSQIYENSKIKSKNNLLKNLQVLTNLKVLRKEKAKGNTFYSLNYENSLLIGLLQLINSLYLQELPFNRRRAIKETILIAKSIISILFGSTAKNNFKKESDIDLLLVYNKMPKKINEKIKEISLRYGVKINPILIEFNDLDTRDETIRHILKTGYPINGGIYFYNEIRKI